MSERVRTEVELLESMYPDDVSFQQHLSELIYTSDTAKLTIRLPLGYPETTLPEIVDASTKGKHKEDLSSQLRRKVKSLESGEEALDTVLSAFLELVDTHTNKAETKDQRKGHVPEDTQSSASKTVVIWLHHLLNTNKRKQALAADDATISGISKPGYPGVLIFSGPKWNVEEHVDGLKSLNWAAFQVRLEQDSLWTFGHGSGVKEVEAMKDVVHEVGNERKEELLEALKIR